MTRRSPERKKLQRLLKPAAVAAGALLSLWPAIGVTYTLTQGRTHPETALRLWPSGGTSHAALSTKAMVDYDWDVARGAGRTALEREPLNVEAVRTLGLAAAHDGGMQRATRLFDYAEFLSRRDVPTQLWLIEANVDREDIPGALVHYNRAMRTSVPSRKTLIPILAQASADPDIAKQLARVLATRPSWGGALVEAILDAKSTPPATIKIILGQLRIKRGDSYMWLLTGGLNRLVGAGEYANAFALYRVADGSDQASAQLLRNGDFAREDFELPFDWWLRNDASLAAVVETRSGTPAHALSIVSDEGRADDVAHQLLLLPAGSYSLSATVGDAVGDELTRPKLSVTCLSGDEIALTAFPQSAGTSATMRLAFTVPETRCAAQWISIRSGEGAAPAETRPWITSLSLQRQ